MEELIMNIFIFQRKRKRKLGLLYNMLLENHRCRNNILRGPYCRLQYHVPVIRNILNGDIQATKDHLRVTPNSFDLLVQTLGYTKRSGWNVEFECMVFLFWLACGTSYRVVCVAFSLSRTTVFDMCNRILNRMMANVQQVIKYPNEEELHRIGNSFARSAGSRVFQQCAGAIDGCHIRIICPSDLHDQYINRKLFYSINLQGVVNDAGLFIDICAGFPGSVHDSRVLRHSNLYRRANYPPRGYFIIGDSGYPCRSQPITIITPYRDPATELHRAFNHSLSSARIIVERSFGMMKTRWRSIFTKALEVKIEKCSKVIVACTMMHNICVSQGDILHVQIEEPRNRQRARNEQGGEDHRDLLLRMFAIENGLN